MGIKQCIKNIGKKLPHAFLVRNIMRNITGHYYSPLPSLQDIEERRQEIFRKKTPLGINLRYESQIQTLTLFGEMKEEIPFYSNQKRIRFNINNESFTYDDAPVLHYMMRLTRPSRIIEIGSGNSSACMLDTNDLYLDGKVDLTFIDVSLKDLRNLLRDDDHGRITMLENRIQDVDLKIFETLEADDILFIDSSHIIKTGSDVHTILFEILPLLEAGVYIHFHDIRYPFEYMEEDIRQRVYWNEAYILRAFLQYNCSFEIVFWLNYLLNSGTVDAELLSCLPLEEWARKFSRYVNESGRDEDRFMNAGGSIWLKKSQP